MTHGSAAEVPRTGGVRACGVARVQRPSARVLPVDEAGRVLLLLGRDPARPSATHWLTVGGGVDASERFEDAAVRELREETGIEVAASQLVGPFHRVDHSFSYAGVDYVSDSSFFAVAVDGDVTITFAGLDEAEVDGLLEARWWDPDELVPGMTSSDLDLPFVVRAAVTALRESGPARTGERG